MILKWEECTQAEKLAIKAMCESSFEMFMRIFFQLLQGQKFNKNWHHTFECQLAEKVYRGELERLIVNVAPGSTKTEIWSVHWPAWCIVKCINNKLRSRWLPLSYSDDLVSENTGRVKEIIESEPFQEMWPMESSRDTKGKSDWKFIDEHGNYHRMYGTSINGQVTGRRAGYMVDGEFTGALIADDPLPPKDSASHKVMEKNNKQMNRVVRSRLAHDKVPIIVIQQRVSKGDTTDYLTSDKFPDDFVLYKIPALIDGEYINGLSKDMKEAAIKDTGFTGKPVSYWPQKEPTATLEKMKKADPYMFSCQYQQDPDEKLSEGVVYRREAERAIEEGRIGSIPVESALPVYTFWDLGINDDMVIWLMQPFRKELRMIACYGNRDRGVEHYINWLHKFADKYDVRYAEHIGPHDLAVRELFGSNGESRIDTAKRMGVKFRMVERVKRKRDSHDALRRVFPRILIDDSKRDDQNEEVAKGCAKGWEAIKTLRREWDPDNETFKDQVIPKWATNYTDALEQMALHYKEKTPKRGRSKGRSGGTSNGWMGS